MKDNFWFQILANVSEWFSFTFVESSCRVFQAEPMLRVTNFSRCLSDVSDSNEDIAPYIPGWRPLANYINGHYMHEHLYTFCPEPWRYTESLLGIDKYLVPYGGRGYIAKLGYDTDTALKVKGNIEHNSWIDDKSAVVIVEFVVFEPASLLLSNVMIIYEKRITGAKMTLIDVVPQYVFLSSGSSFRTFYLVCILFWSILILLLLITEVVKVFKDGPKYFEKFFNWVSFLQLVSSFCAVLFLFLKENCLRNFLRRIRDDPFGSWSALELVKWTKVESIILSIPIVLTTVNCLKLIQFNRHIRVMRSTLAAAYRYICSSAVIIFIFAVGFAQLGTLLFGSRDEEYTTLLKSFCTVLQLAIGIGKEHSKLVGSFAPIFVMACMLCMTIIFTDTFIAILNEAFHQASHRKHQGDEYGAFIKKRLKNHITQSLRKNSLNRWFQSSIRKFASPLIQNHQFHDINEKLSTDRSERGQKNLSLIHNSEDSCEEQGIQRVNDRQTIRRNSNVLKTLQVKSEKPEVQTMKEDPVLHHTIEIFKSQSSGENKAFEIQILPGKNAEENIKDFKMVTFDARYSEGSKVIYTVHTDPCQIFSASEEELLFCELKETMEHALSEFSKYLSNNRRDYF